MSKMIELEDSIRIEQYLMILFLAEEKKISETEALGQILDLGIDRVCREPGHY